MKYHYKKKIIQVLLESNQPLDVERIRVECGIGNWQTALKHCLELQIEGKIQGQKTSKSWVFWNPKVGQFFRNPVQESGMDG